MEKRAVVALRNALLMDGKNKSLKIIFDNGFVFSVGSDMVLWDDAKETVAAIVADGDSGSFEAGLPIKFICSTYENIQFITSNTNVENLETYMDALGKAMNISNENKKKILDWYKVLLDYRRELSPKNYNPTDLKRGSKQVEIKED